MCEDTTTSEIREDMTDLSTKPSKTKLPRPLKVTRQALYDAACDLTDELEGDGYCPVLYHAGPLTLAAAAVEVAGKNEIIVTPSWRSDKETYYSGNRGAVKSLMRLKEALASYPPAVEAVASKKQLAKVAPAIQQVVTTTIKEKGKLNKLHFTFDME